MNAGLLLTREVNLYWLAIPNAGAFLSSLVKGRKEIISAINRLKWKEIDGPDKLTVITVDVVDAHPKGTQIVITGIGLQKEYELLHVPRHSLNQIIFPSNTSNVGTFGRKQSDIRVYQQALMICAY